MVRKSKEELSLPSVSPDATRRWTVIASGFLLLALALVVIYTRRGAFRSPAALIVVAAIGLAALLLQVRLRQGLQTPRSPAWLTVLGILFALFALGGDFLSVPPHWLTLGAFSSVGCFGISGALILHALRGSAPATKTE
jgi:drug/metabolite transporter (DMT)-like permease